MGIELGHISAIFRYPIKSMAGERLDSAKIGWHGVEGDRRLSVRFPGDCAASPWVAARRLPAIRLYAPIGRHANAEGPLPTPSVATPCAQKGAPHPAISQ